MSQSGCTAHIPSIHDLLGENPGWWNEPEKVSIGKTFAPDRLIPKPEHFCIVTLIELSGERIRARIINNDSTIVMHNGRPFIFRTSLGAFKEQPIVTAYPC